MKALFALFLVCLLPVSFSYSRDIDLLEAKIQQRVDRLIEFYDQKSFADLKIDAIRKTSYLPIIGDTDNVPILDDQLKIKTISIHLFRSDEFPLASDQIRQKLSELLRSYRARLVFKETIIQTVKVEPPAPIEVETKEEALRLFESPFMNLFDKEVTVGDMMAMTPVIAFLLFALVFIVIAIVFYVRLSSFQDTVQASGAKSIVQSGPSQSPGQTLGQGQGSKTIGHQTRVSRYDEYSIDLLIPFFSDCYWCERDSYAASVWSDLDLKLKKDLFDRFPVGGDNFLSDYIRYIAKQEVQDGPGDLELSHYIDYPNINHVSCDDLQKYVVNHPNLYLDVSPMRRNSISIEIETKLKLLEGASDQIPQRVNLPASRLRYLYLLPRVVSSCVEEDQKLLKRTFSLGAKKNIVSLIWAKELPESSLRRILESYSSSELAMIWSAPAPILKKMESVLTPKKIEYMGKYSQTLTPDRSHPLFSKMHADIVAELEKFNDSNLELLKSAA